MTDQAFEARISRVLGAYADDAVMPIDASKIAMAARPAHAGLVARLLAVTGSFRPSTELRLLLIAALLLGAIVVGSWLISGSQRTRPGLLDAVPTPVATDQGTPLAASLIGTWVADVPADISFGDPAGPARMSLVLDTGSSAVITTTTNRAERFRAAFTSPGSDRLEFTARTTGDGVTRAGAALQACALGDLGSYEASRSADGFLLTLTPVDDPCASRAAVFGRTWVRSHMGQGGGGLGVVDGFAPLFSVDLPRGSYATDANVTGAVTIAQAFPEFQFLAFRDPQGFRDPCDIRAGRYEIAPGVDAIVAYFRQLPGFTVDSVTERAIDGNRTVRLTLHANLDATCPSGGLAEWQPRATTTDNHWFLRPGDTDTLFVVELADATVMFQVLPSPDGPGERAIDSIRFLDGLPSSP